MPIVRFLPDNKSVQVRPGTTLLEAARKARVSIRTRCGGKASCLMCKVTVTDSQGLSPANEKEQLKLGSLIQQHQRLSCQAQCLADVVAVIPEDPLKAAVRARLLEQMKEGGIEEP